VSSGDEARLASALQRDVPALLRAIAQSAVEEIRVERGGMRLSLRREQAPVAIQPAAESGAALATPTEAPAAPEPPAGQVTSAYVGIFHRSREPGGGMLAEIGDRVEAGTAIGVIETLGMSGDVEAPLTGRLAELLVQDGEAVEYGQPLAVVEPE